MAITINIIIVLQEPYPHGMACTSRIHYYAKGIKEIGGEVNILVPKPTEIDKFSIQNKVVHGIYEGIPFKYTCGTTVRGETFFKRRLLVLKGAFIAAKFCFKKRKTTTALLLVSNSLGYILFFKLITIFFRMIYLQEKSELPFVFRKDGNIITNFYKKLYIEYIYKCFDGILVISHYLLDYFKKKIRKDASLIHVPILVEVNKLNNTIRKRKEEYIFYCGDLSESKDGVLTLVKAFQKVHKKHKKIKLIISGDTKKQSDKNMLFDLINKLGLSENIIFTGYVSVNKLHLLMRNATMLALAKPSSLQANASFPTKIGNYLSTGNPVIVTKIGEITNYLKDGESAYIPEPNNINAFARKIESVLENPQKAQKIGLLGKDIAKNNFDYRIHAKRIIQFINNMI